MKFFRRAGRGLLIAAGAAAVLWVGIAVGPGGSPAQADVYLDLGNALEDLPNLLGHNANRSQVRRVRVNGNFVSFTIEDRAKPPSKVLDDLSEVYRDQIRRSYHGKMLEETLAKAARHPEEAKKIRGAAREMGRALESRLRRREGNGFGYLAYVESPIFETKDYAFDLLKAWKRFQQTGLVSEIGKPRAHLAYRAAGGGATLLSVWPDPDFNVKKLDGLGREDAPGQDPEDFPRPAGSVRLLVLDELLAGVLNRVLVYRSPGTAASHAAGYLENLPRKGFRPNAAWEAARAAGKDLKDFYSFERRGVECDLTLKEDARAGFTYTTLAYRAGVK